MRRFPWVRALVGVGTLAVAVGTLVGTALAHGGSLGSAARAPLTAPAWLIAGGGGAAVAASVLVPRIVTGRGALARLQGHHPLSIPGERPLALAGRVLGVVGLAGVVVVGFLGPADPLSNGAVVFVWAGWWAGFAMSTYLVGNAWPVLNPWRTLARPLSAVGRAYRWQWGAWPSVAGLLALVWLEVVSPLADRPSVLATVVLAYSVVTVAGAVVYGPDVWFTDVDPVARVFRCYGWVAPLGRDESDALVFRLPGTALTGDRLAGSDDVAFVLALLWATMFDGLVTTPFWGRFARRAVAWGVAPVALYPLALVAGFAICWGVYLFAARLARRGAPASVRVPTLARRFAPGLLAVAAGTHLAHFFDYFLSLVPALALAVTAPFATVNPGILVVPSRSGAVAVAAVLAGHVLAVFAVRTTARELFTERPQALAGQYPFTAATVAYTLVSLWVVTRPELAPPFLGV